jgi:diguanylate cyclase (GGDEF)-like protein
LELLGSFTDLANAAVGLVVLFLGFRVVSRLSFRSQRLALRFLLGAVGLWVLAESVEGVFGLFLGGYVSQAEVELVTEGPTELLVTACAATVIYLMHRSDKGEVASLRHLAVTDALTNLPNQAFFSRAASRRFENSRKHDLPLTCLVLDVDDFKAYNDRFGHEAGNAVLRCVGQALRESARADDLVARYGGEEFVMLLNSGVEEAADVAERIRKGVETRCSPGREASVFRQVTVSVGVANLTARIRTLEDLVRTADEEMYRGKRAGKNVVCITRDGKSTSGG